jgi:hypothetical protein
MFEAYLTEDGRKAVDMIILKSRYPDLPRPDTGSSLKR